MVEEELRQFVEALQFVKINVVDEEVEAHIVEVDLIDLVVELSPPQHFKRISIDVESMVAFYFSMA